MKPAKKYPEYNPETDGNYFHWILQTSARIRKENINGQGYANKPLRLDPLTGRVPIRPL